MTMIQALESPTSMVAVALPALLHEDDTENAPPHGFATGPSCESQKTSCVVELSLRELINDPLIALLNRADSISRESFSQLMLSAARLESRRRSRCADHVSVRAQAPQRN